MTDRARWLLGGFACAWYGVHAGFHALAGRPEDALWSCLLGLLLVGGGLLLRSPRLNALGMLWLIWGLPLWLISLLAGEALFSISLVTHLGGPLLGLVGVRLLGMPAGRAVWWQALLLISALQQLTRWLTPPAANVNLAFAVYPGWEAMFPGYLSYAVALHAGGAATFALVELALRRWAAPRGAGPERVGTAPRSAARVEASPVEVGP